MSATKTIPDGMEINDIPILLRRKIEAMSSPNAPAAKKAKR